MKVKIIGQNFEYEDKSLTVSKSVGIYECEFEFDSSWDGFNKTAVFEGSGETIEVVISDGKAEIPWEVLTSNGFLKVGVYGTKDEKVMPTIWGNKVFVPTGTPTGSIGTDPTPSIYAQILAVATNAENVANRVKTEWENVTAEAETLPSGSEATVEFENNTFAFGIPQGERGGDGTDGFSPIVAVTPITNGHRVTITDAEGVHTFDVLDGTDGADGVGITNIVMNADYTLTITLSNGTSYTTPSIRGEQGEKGEDGNGIVSIVKTATSGLVDTYTITYTDGNTSTFEVTNGQDGITDFVKYLPTDTANGTIASFSDGAEDIPVEELKVTLEPIQDLHGQSNPYPAGGGKNLYDDSTLIHGYFNTTTDITTDEAYRVVSLNLKAGTYTLSLGWTQTARLIRKYSDGAIATIGMDSNTYTFTTTTNGQFMLCFRRSDSATITETIKVQVESGSTATAYAPYENLCPISGRNSVEVVRCGVNVWDEEWELGTISTNDGQTYNSDSRIRAKNFNPCLPNTTYYIKEPTTNQNLQLYYYDANKNYVGYSAWVGNNTVTTPANARFFKFIMGTAYGTTYNHDISINYPSTDHNYHQYNGNTYPISLGQTVYGCQLEIVSGALTVTHGYVSKKWSEGVAEYAPEGNAYKRRTFTLPQTFVSGAGHSITNCIGTYNVGAPTTEPYYYIRADGSYLYVWLPLDTDADFTIEMCGELATPTTVTLTPTEVTTLLGYNNIFVTDENGTVEVTYRADIQRYIDKKISALATL